MILIHFGIFYDFCYLIVGQVFQVETNLILQQPRERVEPADNIDDFTQYDVDGMPLFGMCLFVHQDFVQVFFVDSLLMDKYPLKERERIDFGGNTDDALTFEVGYSTFSSHVKNTTKLDKEPNG